jgi:hypothetical protein
MLIEEHSSPESSFGMEKINISASFDTILII